MIVTLEWTKRKFAELNDKIFGGKLVTPEFELMNSGRVYGQVRYYKSHPRTGILLRMSTFFERDEYFLEGTLIHEMCHIYFIQDGKIKVNHGPAFRSLIRKINSKYHTCASEIYSSDGSVAKHVKRKTMKLFIAFDPKKEKYAYFSMKPDDDYNFTLDDVIKAYKGFLPVGTIITCHDIIQGKNATITRNKTNGRYFLTKQIAQEVWKSGKLIEVRDLRYINL